MTSLPTAIIAPRRPASASFTVLATAAVIALLYFGRVFFVTVMVAVIIAFLLDPLVSLVMKLKLPRAFSSFIVCSVALLFLYLVGLGIYTEFASLLEDLPMYSQRMNALADNVGTRVNDMEKKAYELLVPKRFQDQPQIQAAAASAGQRQAREEEDQHSRSHPIASDDSGSAHSQRSNTAL